MGGIAGWVTTGRNAPEESALAPMLKALAHRAGAMPQDAGAMPQDAGAVPQDAGALVAVVDRQGSRQVVLGATLCDRASGVSLMLDGAILNAAELRAELAQKGYSLAGGTDVELLLRAYQRWGGDAAKHLRGAFAFAVWDSRRERLLLARDRFGEKPLYLREEGGAVFFASEVKALLALPNLRAEADPQAARDFLTCRFVPGSRTLFRGIRKLAPASCAFWELGRLRETRYWVAPDREPGAEKERAAPDAVEGFVSRLDEAVRSCAGSGVLLSGGIDSAVIVALMSRGGAALKTFSLGFEGDRASELPQAAQVAKHFGASHQEIVVKPADLVPGLAKLIAARDAPLARPSDLALERLVAEAARGARVVLSGEGCDEILGGYRRHLAERFSAGFSERRHAREALWVEHLVPREGSPFSAPGARDEAARDDKARAKAPPFDADLRSSSLRRALYFDQTSRLPEQLLERNDRAAAAAGIELRMPFLDHALAEYVSSLPDNRRVRGMATKWILREAGKRLIPARLARRKGGFRPPLRDWLRNELRDTLLEHLQSSASLTRPNYGAAALDRMLKEHLEGKNNHEIPLWTLLNLEIWHRQYKPA
jgi:asparagine synthase (glutamine-hydrolysing)